MGVRQFIGSLRRIVRNPQIATLGGAYRHLGWQLRRAAGRFPCELRLSQSVIIAQHGRCGVSALINTHGMYDYNNMRLAQILLTDGGGFIDVGANIGAYTLIAAENERVSVLAFEPHPATFAALQSNIDRNHRANVTAVRAAVGAENGSVQITDTPGSAMTHIVQEPSAASLAVPIVRLDDALAAHDVSPDIVKIDVEGFEAAVIEGFGRRLEQATAVMVEVNGLGEERGGGADAICGQLRGAGFIGPLQFHAVEKLFGPPTGTAVEDPVFVNTRHVGRLHARFGLHIDTR